MVLVSGSIVLGFIGGAAIRRKGKRRTFETSLETSHVTPTVASASETRGPDMLTDGQRLRA